MSPVEYINWFRVRTACKELRKTNLPVSDVALHCGFTTISTFTMPMLVANLLGGYTVDYGVLMLGVFICTIPTAVIFFCFQKSFTEGITGAVK